MLSLGWVVFLPSCEARNRKESPNAKTEAWDGNIGVEFVV